MYITRTLGFDGGILRCVGSFVVVFAFFLGGGEKQQQDNKKWNKKWEKP